MSDSTESKYFEVEVNKDMLAEYMELTNSPRLDYSDCDSSIEIESAFNHRKNRMESIRKYIFYEAFAKYAAENADD